MGTGLPRGATPLYAAIDAASSGDNTIVSAVTGKKIRVLGVLLISAGDATIRFESGAGGTALTGQMTVSAGSGFMLPTADSDVGYFQTAAGELLNLEISAGVSMDGFIVYITV